uniref:uncharacterized protein LOC122582540 isoform X2 n=1 Tax=Erigeron canadensis TaxID=72917 RepID=UPI001CB8A1FA|nr:uncharacterized protein LOC122582540 isoform X2 [Erigeron canadensis]
MAADNFLQTKESLHSLQLALARVAADVARIQKEFLMLQESSKEIADEFSSSEDTPELEGIHSEIESSSSLYGAVTSSTGFVNSDEVNLEIEISASKVFDEMPDRIRNEFETQFSDIYICETILREIHEQNVDIQEVPKYEKDNTLIVNIDVIMDDSSNLKVVNNSVILDDSSDLDFW